MFSSVLWSAWPCRSPHHFHISSVVVQPRFRACIDLTPVHSTILSGSLSPSFSSRKSYFFSQGFSRYKWSKQYNGLYCIVFIHFYSASHSKSLSEALPTAIDTLSEFTRWSANGKVPMWRLEHNSNPRPSGRKASTLPIRHYTPRCQSMSVVFLMFLCRMFLLTNLCCILSSLKATVMLLMWKQIWN